jgi:Uncharacterized protein conserved in bacteria
MSDNNAVLQDSVNNSSGGGNVTFANDVIATIAALAAHETEGIAGMSGGKGLGEMMGFKNLTKGVKVEVGTEEVAVDVFVIVKYGYRIQDVAGDIQKNVRSAVENMTGLRVVEVNVYVQGIIMEKEQNNDSEVYADMETDTTSSRVN